MICGHGTAAFGSNQKFTVNFCNFLAISNKKNYGEIFVKNIVLIKANRGIFS